MQYDAVPYSTMLYIASIRVWSSKGTGFGVMTPPKITRWFCACLMQQIFVPAMVTTVVF